MFVPGVVVYDSLFPMFLEGSPLNIGQEQAGVLLFPQFHATVGPNLQDSPEQRTLLAEPNGGKTKGSSPGWS